MKVHPDMCMKIKGDGKPASIFRHEKSDSECAVFGFREGSVTTDSKFKIEESTGARRFRLLTPYS